MQQTVCLFLFPFISSALLWSFASRLLLSMRQLATMFESQNSITDFCDLFFFCASEERSLAATKGRKLWIATGNMTCEVVGLLHYYYSFKTKKIDYFSFGTIFRFGSNMCLLLLFNCIISFFCGHSVSVDNGENEIMSQKKYENLFSIVAWHFDFVQLLPFHAKEIISKWLSLWLVHAFVRIGNTSSHRRATIVRTERRTSADWLWMNVIAMCAGSLYAFVCDLFSPWLNPDRKICSTRRK